MLRRGVRGALERALVESGGSQLASEPASEPASKLASGRASELEEAIYAKSSNKSDYMELKNEVENKLKLCIDPWETKRVGCEFLAGRMGTAEVLGWTPPPPDPRQTGRVLIYRALRDGDGCPDEEAKRLASETEGSCYSNVIETCSNLESAPIRTWENPIFRRIYDQRISTVAANLTPLSSVGRSYPTAVRASLLRGEITPGELGRMRANELCPEATREERELFQARLNQKIEGVHSKLHRCPKCGARDASTRQVQMRSLDEGATTMATCNVCGEDFRADG